MIVEVYVESLRIRVDLFGNVLGREIIEDMVFELLRKAL